MTPAERALVQVSAALASGDKAALTAALSGAFEVADPLQVEEVILQSYLFLGFPAALNGMAAWRRLAGASETEQQELDCNAWADRGHHVCGRVYAGQYEKLRETVRDLHSDLEQWMVVEGYGKVLGRPGLSLRIRELCVVASLSVVGALKQLYSHLRGAVNVGADPVEVGEALAQADPFLDEEGRRHSIKVWEKVQERRSA